MLRFLRMNNSFNPGTGNGESYGTGTQDSGTVLQQKGARRRPPPLQLDDQTGGNNSNSNNTATLVDNADSQVQPSASRGISGTASQFPFYHAYLTEEQEENAFKDHLIRTGSFLMRDSKSNRNAVTLSVVIDPLHLYHFQVVKVGKQFEVVGMGKRFSSLDAVLEHYTNHSIPGKKDEPVCLKYPISCDRRSIAAPSSPPPATLLQDGLTTPRSTSFRPPPTPLRNNPNGGLKTTASLSKLIDRTNDQDPPSSQQGQRTMLTFPRKRHPTFSPTLEPLQRHPGQPLYQNPSDSSLENEVAGSSNPLVSADLIDFRPPMPIPRPPTEPGKSHIYSEADHPDLDRIKMVLELCKQSDMMHTSRKKCTCGLYLEESTLTDGWMMHIDNEPGKTEGRIFFLDTKTQSTTWTLPEEVEADLKSQFPVKWEFVQRQTAYSQTKKKSSCP